MKLEELQKKFYYVQVRNKYEILKAHELLEKIDVKVLENDEHKIKVMNLDDSKYVKNTFDGRFFIIKKGDGWNIQSHFIATDNTIEELEEEVYLYLRNKDKKEMSESDREDCNKKITDLNKELQSFLCYVYINYKDEEDIKKIKSEINYLSERVSSRFGITYEKFKKKEDFVSTLEAFIRENKINQIFN